MEGRYPRPSKDEDDGSSAREAIMAMVIEGRARWREFQAKGQAVIKGETI